MMSKLEFARLPAADGVNGWWETLTPTTATRFEGERDFDFVVIGGGITGLCAARRLAELAPNASVALVEADRIGRSTAGRNSGFFIDLPHDISSESYSRSVDADKADIHMQRHGIDYVRSIVAAQQIDCDWRDDGKFHAAVNKRGEEALQHFADGLRRIGEPFECLDGAGIAKVTGTAFYRNAVFTPGCSTVQPAALMQGLAQTMPSNVAVFELSPVMQLEPGPSTAKLSFAKGKMKAGKVILCTNAYAANFGGRPNGLLPVYTFASLTRRLTPAEVAALGGRESWALIPADPMGTTVRRLGSDRICIRNHFAFRPDLTASEADLNKARILHRRSFERRFPMLGNMAFDYTWGGALCLSANSGAFFGRRDDGLYQAIGCNGLGLSRGSASGKVIAEYALGQSSDMVRQLLDQPTPRLLPMPLISNIAVSAAIWLKEFSAGIEL